jgi:hypothetical protein
MQRSQLDDPRVLLTSQLLILPFDFAVLLPILASPDPRPPDTHALYFVYIDLDQTPSSYDYTSLDNHHIIPHH